jgi:hypothetical protein
MHTENVMNTQVYMVPECKNDELSTKVDSFVFGLVVLETLTGYPVCSRDCNLLSMFQDEYDTTDTLRIQFDNRAYWDQYKQEHSQSV